MAFSKMLFLFSKFQQGVGVLAKSPTFAKSSSQLQFEADINKLFMFTSYNRLGRDAEEADAEEIIEMASKATLPEQQKQVQENIHYQVQNFCSSMDKILLPDIHKTFVLTFPEVSRRLKDLIGYTLAVKPSLIPHKEAGQGCFVEGEADVGAVLAFYPGVIYSPAFYKDIPGYPNARNSYLITRHDGVVINAQPWGCEGLGNVEARNPLAFGHFANHPGKEMEPNVMVCPYDFSLSEKDMRRYIPNVAFENTEDVKTGRLGSFLFKTESSTSGIDAPVLKTLVLVATRALCNEELMLNYRLSSSERLPEWYTPVDEEEEDLRR